MGLKMQSRWMLAAAFGASMTAASPVLALDEGAQTVAGPAAEAPAARAGLGVKELAMMERVGDPRGSPDPLWGAHHRLGRQQGRQRPVAGRG